MTFTPEQAMEVWRDAGNAAWDAAPDNYPEHAQAAAAVILAAVDAETRKLREALKGMVEIEDMMDAEGECERAYIEPRVAAARALLADQQEAGDA